MDPIDAVRHPDPYPYYDALASSRALVRCPARGVWIAAHPETVREVLASDACAVRPVAEPVPIALVGTAVGDVFARLVRMRDDAGRAAVREVIASALAALPDAVVAREATRAARQLLAEAAGARVRGVSRRSSRRTRSVACSACRTPRCRSSRVRRCASRRDWGRARGPRATTNVRRAPRR